MLRFLLKSRSRSLRGEQLPVHAQKTTIIPAHSVLPIYMHHLHQVPKDRDYLFEPGEVNFGLPLFWYKTTAIIHCVFLEISISDVFLN